MMKRYTILLSILVCTISLPSGACYGQIAESKPPQFDYQVVPAEKIPTKVAPDEDLKKLGELAARYAEVQNAFVARIESLKTEMVADKTTAQRKVEIERLIPKLTAELKRIQDTMIDILGKKKEGQPPPIDPKSNPFIPSNPDPEVYDGSKDDPSKKILELAAAGICVMNPPICPFVMIFASLLDLDAGTIHEKIAKMNRLHGVFGSGQIGEKELNDVLDLANTSPGLGATALEALLGQGKFANDNIKKSAQDAFNAAKNGVAKAVENLIMGENNPVMRALIADLSDGKLDSPPQRFANSALKKLALDHAKKLQGIIGKRLDEAIKSIEKLPPND